jgi:acetolactate synthase-1/2/3 large subunit
MPLPYARRRLHQAAGRHRGLSEQTGGDATLVTGVGQHQMWSAQYYASAGRGSGSAPAALGTMGFGLPAAIGAWFAIRNTRWCWWTATAASR